MLTGVVSYGLNNSASVDTVVLKEGSEYYVTFSGPRSLFENENRTAYWNLFKDLQVVTAEYERLLFAVKHQTLSMVDQLDVQEIIDSKACALSDYAEKMVSLKGRLSETVYRLLTVYLKLKVKYLKLTAELKTYSVHDNTDYTNDESCVDCFRSGEFSVLDEGEFSFIEGKVHCVKHVHPLFVRINILKGTYKTNVPNLEFVEKFVAGFLYPLRNLEFLDDDKFQEWQHFRSQGSVDLVDTKWETKATLTYHFENIHDYIAKTAYLSFNFTEICFTKGTRPVTERTWNSVAYVGNAARPDSFFTTKEYTINETTLGFFMHNNLIHRLPTAGASEFFTTLKAVNEAHKDRHYDWLLKQDYHIVTDETLPYVLNRIRQTIRKGKPMGLDTETTGFNINVNSREGLEDGCTGFSISLEEGNGYYFPLQMRSIPNLWGGDHYSFMQMFRKYLEDKEAKWVLHNVAFDWKVFYIYGIKIHYVADTMLMCGVTFRYRFGTSFKLGLKDLTERKDMLNLHMYHLTDFVKSGDFGKTDEGACFADLPGIFVKYYATADADMTLRLYNLFVRKGLIEAFNAHDVLKIETKFAAAAAYSMFCGLHIDMSRMPKLIEDIDTNREKYRKIVLEEAHKLGVMDFDNPSSSDQLKHIFYDVLKLDPNKNPGKHKGEKSTNKDVYNMYADMLNPDDTLKYPFLYYLREFKKVEQPGIAFVDSRYKTIHYHGYVFSSVFPLGTETGRLSSKEPNVQSYNDFVKEYVTGRLNHMCFDCDYSQVELRMMFSMAGQQNLIELSNDPVTDLHTIKAMTIFNVPYALVTKKMRKTAKKFNFGAVYGMSLYSMAADLNLSLAEAQKRYDAYFSDMLDVKAYLDRARDQGVTLGYTETLAHRRRWYLSVMGVWDQTQDIFDFRKVLNPSPSVAMTTGEYNSVRRMAGNHIIQGSSADVWKIAVNNLVDMLDRNDWWDKFLFGAFIHDEVFGEIDESIDYNSFVRQWLDAFEVKLDGFCNLFAGCGIGYSWSEAKHMDLPPLYIRDVIERGKSYEWDYAKEDYYHRLVDNFFKFKVDYVRSFLDTTLESEEVIEPVAYEYLKEVVCFNKYSDEYKINTLGITSDYDIYVKLLRSELNDYYSKESTFVSESEREPLIRTVVDSFTKIFENRSAMRNPVYDVSAANKAHKTFIKQLNADMSHCLKEAGFEQYLYTGINFGKAGRNLAEYLKAYCDDYNLVYDTFHVIAPEDAVSEDTSAEFVYPTGSLLKEQLVDLKKHSFYSNCTETDFVYEVKDDYSVSELCVTSSLMREYIMRYPVSFRNRIRGVFAVLSSLNIDINSISAYTTEDKFDFIKSFDRQDVGIPKIFKMLVKVSEEKVTSLDKLCIDRENLTLCAVDGTLEDYVLKTYCFTQEMIDHIFNYATLLQAKAYEDAYFGVSSDDSEYEDEITDFDYIEDCLVPEDSINTSNLAERTVVVRTDVITDFSKCTLNQLYSLTDEQFDMLEVSDISDIDKQDILTCLSRYYSQ